MSSRAIVPVLVGGMLLTGVCNTLITKYQDMQCVGNCDALNPSDRLYFNRPAIQTLQMFIGELFCWVVMGVAALVSYIHERRMPTALFFASSESDALLSESPSSYDDDGFPDTAEDGGPSTSSSTPNKRLKTMVGWEVTYFAIPAFFDLIGTTLLNVGLLLVTASIYQMTRGILVLFVGAFSVLFLKRHFEVYQWSALVVCVMGVALVGIAGALSPSNDNSPDSQDRTFGAPDNYISSASVINVKAVVGVLCIAGAQVFAASQFVVEEKILDIYSVSMLQTVGWEGIWGTLGTMLAMTISHFAYGRTEAGKHGIFDAHEGFSQTLNNKAIAIASLLVMLSISGFNFFGLSITYYISATSRSTIHTCCTLLIWLVSLGLGWESFKWLQVVGFALLVYGTFLFNDLIQPPLRACMSRNHEEL